LDHPQRVSGGIYRCVKFGWTQCSSLNNMPILMFCEFDLKMPIHAPFWVVLGRWTDPLISKFVTQTGLYCSKQLETTFNQFGKNTLHITLKAKEKSLARPYFLDSSPTSEARDTT